MIQLSLFPELDETKPETYVASINSECKKALQIMVDKGCMVDSIVTDPPYELSNDGKASPYSVFFEFMFPQNPNLKPHGLGGNCLSLLIDKVLSLRYVRKIPTETPTMPISSVTFDNQPPIRNYDVENESIGTAFVSDSIGTNTVKSKDCEYLGSFFLKLTDPTKLFQILNEVGSGFHSSGIGVGLCIDNSCLPSLFHSLSTVVSFDNNIGLSDNPASQLIHAINGTIESPMLRFQLAGTSEEILTANGASMFCAILQLSGAELIRTDTVTCGLPSMLKARRICVVDGAANRAFSFDILVHEQDISTKGFMNKEWDGSKIAYDVELWELCLKVLKPGGHLLAFGGSRTYHRMACAIEDAGFEIRDQIQWIYGQGFPKSLDISKQLDKRGGVSIGWFGKWLRKEREARGIAQKDLSKLFPSKTGGLTGCFSNWELGFNLPTPEQFSKICEALNLPYSDIRREAEREVIRAEKSFKSHYGTQQKSSEFNITAPATEAAKQWEGWGSQLKPAHEPIVLARKPLSEKNIAENVLKHGTGGINIDGCRVGYNGESPSAWFDKESRQNAKQNVYGGGKGLGNDFDSSPSTGRFPANLIHDGSDEVMDEFAKYGERKSGSGQKNMKSTGNIFNGLKPKDTIWESSNGTAARFFKEAPYSEEETKGRFPSNLIHDGSEEVEAEFSKYGERKSGSRQSGEYEKNSENRGGFGFGSYGSLPELKGSTGSAARFFYSAKASKKDRCGSKHPTVKPIALMRYLCRLVTPPNGIVLDPFAGTGTTGYAAQEEGLHAILIEKDEGYFKDIVNRIYGGTK